MTDAHDTLPSRRSGERLDELAELEEERRFLLRSLTDLEREHDAGDVDDGDYETLRDGYTVRAADVLRQIEAGRANLPAARPRRRGRVALVVGALLVGAIGLGAVLASSWGERGAGQEIPGFTPGDDARTVLASARQALRNGDFDVANSLFGRVVEVERERGVDNPEAIAYFGWTLALLTRNDPDPVRSEQRLDASRLALAQAIEIDPDYADPYCFLAIIEHSFRDDPVAALPRVERCEASNPPADVADLVAGF
ncbi:MAG: hypothetical protein ACR2O6_07125, partial [Ilumatobacteraceae bacterium]